MAGVAELVARAQLICGAAHVITSPAELSVYRSDGVKRDRTSPLPVAAMLPADGVEVAGVVQACAQLGVPFTVRGAGTTTSGAALPVPGAVMIVLSRLRRILAVDLDDDQVTVQPGVPIAALRAALAPTHTFPGDSVATVGGEIADGAEAGQLLGADLVLADGAFVRLAPLQPGYDVAGAFPGSRGHRGIAVALTVRVEPVA